MTRHTIQPVTQRFLLNEETRKKIHSMTPKFGFNGLGEVVFRRTYSRDNESWHDVVIRVIQGVMSLRKEHFHRNTLSWNDAKWQSFACDMAISLFKMEWLPPGRGLWMMGTDFVYERGSMALNNCFSQDTKFWTMNGLKSFKDYNDGDSVMVRGKKRWRPATVKSFGTQDIWELKIVRNGQIQSIFTTLGHRWLSRDRNTEQFTVTTTIDLYKNFELYTNDHDHWKVIGVSKTNRTENVWCVVEPENEEFTLENGIVTKNCASTDTADDLVLSAEWTMDGLMNGVGVGFSTTWRGEATKPDKNDTETVVINDSREGWVNSLIKLMCSYVYSNAHGTNKFPTFDYSQIRPQGLPIKGFGGTSSGPAPLMKMLDRIEGFLDCFCAGHIEVNGVKKEYNHTRLVADIFNAIGACVVAGNV